MEKVNYLGWPDCIRLSNKEMELILTTAVGPRIIHCGFIGGQNIFGVIDESKGVTGGDEWHLFGGHRLWHSPENKPRSYSPDNAPVEVVQEECCVRLIQAMEQDTRIQKEIAVSLDPDCNAVTVTHRLTNCNPWDVELAPWALTVMAKGGECICPQPQGEFDSLLPNRRLILWPYTNMSDPRLTWGERYIRMRQDATMPRRCKYGLSAEDGWLAYLLNGDMFVKRFDYDYSGDYPDWGAAVEVFTNDAILEVETLGTLYLMEPGETIEHEERWYLFRGVTPGADEASLDAEVWSRVETTD
jgi:hypothetical protein